MANAPRSAVISMRLPPDAKARFAALAARHRLSESALMARLVDEVLKSNADAGRGSGRAAGERFADRHAQADVRSDARITLRLRPGDRTLAEQCAGARGMKTASYLALLIHNHVRCHAVLPPNEVGAIKATTAQLAALGRQLRMFGMPNTWPEPEASALRDLIAHARHEVELAREATSAVVRRNLLSWEAGDA